MDSCTLHLMQKIFSSWKYLITNKHKIKSLDDKEIDKFEKNV